MTKDPTFEIKTAVIGPVSAGKNTLINAPLVGKYSEVAERRTTAGVNFFCVHPPNPVRETDMTEPVEDEGSPSTGHSHISNKTDASDKILCEIKGDNTQLWEHGEVCEKTFDIEGINICPCRDDTKVVIVDVPGINETESSSNYYHDYVARKWKIFDCVILVMDARHGVNSEEQVDLLQFVKSNKENQRNVPTVILFNKADELDDQEKQEIITEMWLKISSIFDILPSHFNVDDNGNTLPGPHSSTDLQNAPVYLPISARNGYMYHLASIVNQNRFKELQQDLIKSLGREHQIGLLGWNRLDVDQKYEATPMCTAKA